MCEWDRFCHHRRGLKRAWPGGLPVSLLLQLEGAQDSHRALSLGRLTKRSPLPCTPLAKTGAFRRPLSCILRGIGIVCSSNRRRDASSLTGPPPHGSFTWEGCKSPRAQGACPCVALPAPPHSGSLDFSFRCQGCLCVEPTPAPFLPVPEPPPSWPLRPPGSTVSCHPCRASQSGPARASPDSGRGSGPLPCLSVPMPGCQPQWGSHPGGRPALAMP